MLKLQTSTGKHSQDQSCGACLLWLKKRVFCQFTCRFSPTWMPDKHSLGQIQERFPLLSLKKMELCRLVFGWGPGLCRESGLRFFFL